MTEVVANARLATKDDAVVFAAIRRGVRPSVTQQALLHPVLQQIAGEKYGLDPTPLPGLRPIRKRRHVASESLPTCLPVVSEVESLQTAYCRTLAVSPILAAPPCHLCQHSCLLQSSEPA